MLARADFFFILVLVKCRQNVANTSRYVNPVCPCNKLTALTAKCSTERSPIQRRSRQAVSLCGGTENLYMQYYCSGFWSSWGMARNDALASGHTIINAII